MKNQSKKLSLRVIMILVTAALLMISMTVGVLADETSAAAETGESGANAPETAPYETDADGDYVFESSGGGFSLFDILLVPMGFIIRVCYSITKNYAAALFLFALVMQLVLLPLGIKQQKNMNRQASLRPKESAIRKKYAGRTDSVTQKKMNDEIMALYQQENFNPASGCLPLLIQLPIIFALFAVVRQPLTYITRLPANVIAALQERLSALGGTLTPGYEEISVISYLKEHGAAAISGFGKYITPEVVNGMPNFKMFGGRFDLSVVPSSNFLSIYLLVPLFTFIFMYGSMKLTRKFMYQPEPAGDKQAQTSMKIMDLLSPVMCTYFAFIVPSAIGIYWMYRNILAIVQQFALSKIFPTPRFTEEQLKEAEREYLGKTKKSKTERDPNKPKPRSLHRIDFDDDDEEPAPAPKEKPKKTDSPIAPAPLKDGKNNDDGEK